jgi:outer membrane protein assembly factor BamB
MSHTGQSSVDTSGTTGAFKWQISVPSTNGLDSSPVIGADGTIYIGAGQDQLWAISPADGTVLWTFNPTPDVTAPVSTPAVAADGTIYVVIGWKLYALNPNGTQKWVFTGTDRNGAVMLVDSPTIGSDGTIFIGGTSLFAVNPDGTQKWTYPLPAELSGSPAISPGGDLFISDGCGYFWFSTEGAFHGNHNDPVCSFSGGASSPTVDPNNPNINSPPYVGCGQNCNALDGTGPGGQYVTGGPVSSTAAVDLKNNIYFGSFDGTFYALRYGGFLLWSFTPPNGGGIGSSAAIGAEGTIYLSGYPNTLYAFNPDGTIKWKFTGPSGGADMSSLAIGPDGTIYMHSPDHGNLYAIGSGAQVRPSPTPTVTPTPTATPTPSHYNIAGSWCGGFFDSFNLVNGTITTTVRQKRAHLQGNYKTSIEGTNQGDRGGLTGNITGTAVHLVMGVHGTSCHLDANATYCPANTTGCPNTGQIVGSYTQHGCNQRDDGAFVLGPCQ